MSEISRVKNAMRRLRNKGYTDRCLVEVYINGNSRNGTRDEKTLWHYANENFTNFLKIIVEESDT